MRLDLFEDSLLSGKVDEAVVDLLSRSLQRSTREKFGEYDFTYSDRTALLSNALRLARVCVYRRHIKLVVIIL